MMLRISDKIFLFSGQISLENISYLVLDEADEMLNQGFEPQVNKALLRIRTDRQTVLTR
jgi:ATP-dependent RNA helicase DDX5/DBP2